MAEKDSRYEGLAYYGTTRVVRAPSPQRLAVSRLLLPVLALLSAENSARLGLVPLDDERVLAALKHARGRLLDVGCGSNTFVRSYGDGLGVDVVPWGGVDLVVEDAGRLPFEDASFDTVSFLACLNHIPNRQDALFEAHRVLRPGGLLIVTMLSPRVGRFVHSLRRSHDPDRRERGAPGRGEALGLSPKQVAALIDEAGFTLESASTFVWRLNRIYLATKAV